MSPGTRAGSSSLHRMRSYATLPLVLAALAGLLGIQVGSSSSPVSPLPESSSAPAFRLVASEQPAFDWRFYVSASHGLDARDTPLGNTIVHIPCGQQVMADAVLGDWGTGGLQIQRAKPAELGQPAQPALFIPIQGTTHVSAFWPGVGPTCPPPLCDGMSGNRLLGCQAVLERFAPAQAPREWGCLDTLWGTHESGWNHLIYNRSSGAGGIPQALPANKMAAAGGDWSTNPMTQIIWGLDHYIQDRYQDSPCIALAFWDGHHWY